MTKRRRKYFTPEAHSRLMKDIEARVLSELGIKSSMESGKFNPVFWAKYHAYMLDTLEDYVPNNEWRESYRWNKSELRRETYKLLNLEDRHAYNEQAD